MTQIVSATFRLRADSAANWESVNPILGPREPGIALDTLQLKIGDGTTAWDALPYATNPFSATLTAIGELTPAADSAIYFPDGETAALFDLTAFGRAIVAADDAAALLAMIGLDGLEDRLSAIETAIATHTTELADHESRIAALE